MIKFSDVSQPSLKKIGQKSRVEWRRFSDKKKAIGSFSQIK
jgi:hypothetical protein